MSEMPQLSILEALGEIQDRPPPPQTDPIVIREHVWIKDKVWQVHNPFVLDGQNKLIFKEGLDIQDCHNFEIRNCWIFGGLKLDFS